MSKQEALDFLQQYHDSQKEFDLDYILCVLFPECYPAARVPSKFSVPSALFTHRFSLYMSTGSSGQGAIVLLPLDTTFHCLYSATTYDGNSSNAMLGSITYHTESSTTFIPNNYAQARLIGASLRVQYIGQAQQESGFMTAGHVYESEIGRVSDEIIENGYFLVRGRPSQGVRLVWVPKDNADMEFFDTNFRIEDTNSGTDQNVVPSSELLATNSNCRVETYLGTDWVDSSTTERPIPPNLVWGHGAKKLQASSPTQLMVSWRGLTSSQTWFRVDVERHFEGVPRTAIRDLVAVARPKASEKSLEALKKLTEVEQLFGQKQAEADITRTSMTSKLTDTLSDVVSNKVLPAAIDIGLKYASNKILGTGAQPMAETIEQGINYIGKDTKLTGNFNDSSSIFGDISMIDTSAGNSSQTSKIDYSKVPFSFNTPKPPEVQAFESGVLHAMATLGTAYLGSAMSGTNYALSSAVQIANKLI